MTATLEAPEMDTEGLEEIRTIATQLVKELVWRGPEHVRLWGILVGLRGSDHRLAMEAHLALRAMALSDLQEAGWLDTRYSQLLLSLHMLLTSEPCCAVWDKSRMCWTGSVADELFENREEVAA